MRPGVPKGKTAMSDKTFQDMQWENKEPRQYAIYKGVTGKFGAMRMKLKKPYTGEDRSRPDGCIFLEMAPAKGPNHYDWENNKIIMALGITDISKIILYLRAPSHSMFQTEKADGKLKIFHDKGAGTADRLKNTTTLEIANPPNLDNIFINAYQKRNGSSKKANVSLSADEAIAMGTLLQAAISKILAWD